VSQNSDGSWYIGVDSTNTYAWENVDYAGNNNLGRPSVRFQTEKTWQYGLFIADIAHMPGGICGTWPAFWTIGSGADWPYAGEIDILEGRNSLQNTLSSLHTGNTCSIAGDSRTQTGTLQNTDCDYASGANPIGCGVTDNTSNNYGSGFNDGSVPGSGQTGGGIYAMEWKSDGIKIWFFPRSNIPQDLFTDSPDPSGWGIPYADLAGDCDFTVTNFQNHRIVVDNTFCGDLAGNTWSQSDANCQASTGVSTCAQYVGENPTAFTDA
jgi:Glycosyl hydrolases family 16